MSDKIVTIGSSQHEIVLEREATRFRNGDQEIDLRTVTPHEVEVDVAGRTLRVPYTIEGSTVSFSFGGSIWVADVADKGARTRARHRDHSTSAPMPGAVLKILVNAGDAVAKGAPLLILEAMKMEHQITAPFDGTIVSVNCTEGEMVQPGVELITLEESTQESPAGE